MASSIAGLSRSLGIAPISFDFSAAVPRRKRNRRMSLHATPAPGERRDHVDRSLLVLLLLAGTARRLTPRPGRSLAVDGAAAGRRLGRRREQARQQDFVHRANHLAGLAPVRQLFDMIQYN